MLEVLIVVLGGLTIGAVLGLLGAGGAILSIPMMVHWLQYPLQQAMGASLFIVFFTALVSVWRGWQEKDMSLTLALIYAGFGAITSAITAKLAPDWNQEYRRIAFIGLLALSGSAVFWPKPTRSAAGTGLKSSLWSTIAKNAIPASLIGMVAGGLGVGGGFMLVPLLHIVSGLPMSRAVGTAMIVILANSGFGFVGALPFLLQSQMRWWPVFGFTLLSITMSQWLVRYRSRINPRALKIAFACVLWAIALLEGLYYALA